MERLYNALRLHLPQSPDAEILDTQISHIELLNGVIYEALRLFPPNPSHPTRVTPAEGVVIGGKFVPGGTQVMAPQYVIGRGKYMAPILSSLKALTDMSLQTKTYIHEQWSSFQNAGSALRN